MLLNLFGSRALLCININFVHTFFTISLLLYYYFWQTLQAAHIDQVHGVSRTALLALLHKSGRNVRVVRVLNASRALLDTHARFFDVARLRFGCALLRRRRPRNCKRRRNAHTIIAKHNFKTI